MKTHRIHLRLRVPSRLRSNCRPSIQGIDTCRQQSALREGMMIARSRWSTPTGSLSQNRSGNDARKQMESPENSLSFRLDLKDCLNWSFNQCAQTTNTKLPSLPDAGIRIHSPYAPRAPDSPLIFADRLYHRRRDSVERIPLIIHRNRLIAASGEYSAG